VSAPPLRWGVLGGTSYVARLAVLPALRASPSAALCRVASRDANGGCGAYGDVLADPDVEAVYVPLPNALHHEWTLRCAAAGKHVLCEKPMAVNADEAEEMAEACAHAGVVLMEAYMTPFHPRAAAVVDVSRRELGTLRSARTVFTFPLRDSGNHRWRPEMGGGALLDVGIYCLSPLLAIAGREPLGVAAATQRSASGVDATTSGVLDFGDGFTASFTCSFEAEEQQLIEVTGSRGTLRAERVFTGGIDDVEIDLAWADGTREGRRTPGVDPYRAMVENFAAVVRGNAAPLRDVGEAVRMARLLDAVRSAATAAR
jgi:D-xylose 1-dehydrogenase (NADP+, D-xylono-1,5-lactone-forming)